MIKIKKKRDIKRKKEKKFKIKKNRAADMVAI